MIRIAVSNNLFAAIDFNDFILIDIFENVWGVHQNANGAGRCYNEEYIELQTIDNHCHVFPILARLKSKHKKHTHSINYRIPLISRASWQQLYLDIRILILQMLGNKFDGFRCFACLRRQKNGIRAFAFATTRIGQPAQIAAAVQFSIYLTIRMMQVRQFHNFHLRRLGTNRTINEKKNFRPARQTSDSIYDLICFGSSVGEPYGFGWGGTLIPGISIIQRKRVLRGRFINSIAGK